MKNAMKKVLLFGLAALFSATIFAQGQELLN